MLKILVLVFILSTFLFSSKLTKSDTLEYENALKSFKNKEYQKSYKLFDELFFKYLGNEDINFYLARSAYELAKYNDAISAYERILIKNEFSVTAKYELARCYYSKENYAKSKQLLDELKSDKHPIKVQNKINAYLKMIDDKMSKIT